LIAPDFPRDAADASPTLSFVKMEGLGNDFLVLDFRATAAPAWLDDCLTITRLCDRHRGVGADGVLAVLPARPGVAAVARMRVLNADGSEAEMCGNGLRCVAKYLFEHDPALAERPTPGLGAAPCGPSLEIETGAGVLRCELPSTATDRPTALAAGEREIEIAMGAPRLQRAAIPMGGPVAELCLDEPLVVAGEALRLTAVSMGNPHAVVFVPADVSGHALYALAQRLGPQVERHPLFPQRTNVEFCHRRTAEEYEVVVWERGCGITQACGTGACAVAVAACRLGLSAVDRWLTIQLPGGPLQIRVLPGEREVKMRGPARSVYWGRLALTGT
jgi:diaminopimelate epimerase